MPDVDASWERIEVWLRSCAPVSLASLRAAAPLERVRAAGTELGVRLDDQLVTSLLRHDGVEMQRGRFCFPATYTALSAADMAQSRTSLRGLADEHPDRQEDTRLASQWAPFAESVTGGWLVVDCAPGPNQGRVGTFTYGDGVRFGHPSLAAFMDTIATALERSRPVGRHRPVVADGALWWRLNREPPPEVLERARQLRERAQSARRAADGRPSPTDVFRRPGNPA